MKKFLSVLIAFTIGLGLLPFAARAQAASTERAAGTVSTASGRLNVRTGKSTASAVAAALDRGSLVTLVERSGDWWRVEYDSDRYGYCHADYIRPISGTAAAVRTSSGNLNVRSGAGTYYSVTDRLPSGTPVVILSDSGGWSRILYHGVKIGYVSSSYLSASSGTGSAAVQLSLPDFKQTDSRWAHVQIGSSGKTIAQIGCTTTAIAMMESHRTGRTVYPDAMARQLSYSPSGDVYWPGNYQVVTDSTGYLQTVLELLRQGKPVLFGAKKSSGSQHWVVITGYTGGAVTASEFTVNDPGSGSRRTLQDLLRDYPVFYKFFYYK